eukprot:SAG31_NODE_213_length_20124_cov_17.709613_1_plen_84_part_00
MVPSVRYLVLWRYGISDIDLIYRSLPVHIIPSIDRKSLLQKSVTIVTIDTHYARMCMKVATKCSVQDGYLHILFTVKYHCLNI